MTLAQGDGLGLLPASVVGGVPERKWLFFEKEFFGKTNHVAGLAGRRYTADMWGKVVVGVAVAGVVGLYWARPDLMVALLIVIAVAVYGWRHPDLDDWRGH